MHRLRFDSQRSLWLIVGCLIALNLLRLWGHELWRDELQAWRLAVESPDLAALFRNLQWEAHPPLWYLLLWPLARLTENPLAMKMLQGIIATAIYLLIAWKAPFSVVEKVLVLLSYFLFFEYWVISRNYGLGVLLTLAFVHSWRSAGPSALVPWLLLGLMANTNVYAAILALALGCGFALQHRSAWRRLVPGAALFAVLLAIAVASMLRAHTIAQQMVAANLGPEESFRLLRVVTWLVPRVFVPIDSEFPDHFWDPNFSPLLRLLMIAPVLALIFLALREERDLVLVMGLCLIGVGAFTYLFYDGSPRHWGMLFVAFVCCLWMLCARGHRLRWPAHTLLAVNAVAGIGAAVAAQLGPFSQSGNVARWIEAHGLTEAPWAGVRAPTAAAVAGQLGEAIYFPSCDCRSTYVAWGRQRWLSPDETAQALARFVRMERAPQAFLVADVETGPTIEASAAAADLRLTPLARFLGAEVTDENYIVYRMSLEPTRARGMDDGREALGSIDTEGVQPIGR